MLIKHPWSFKEIMFLLSAIAFILLLNGAVPLLMMPTFGQAIWSMGFAQSFANGPWHSLYSHDFGIPHPAAMAFGLSGAWPASLLIRFGLHAYDAYSSMFACYLILAFSFAYKICIGFGNNRLCSILGSVTWLSMPIIWAHNGYSMLALGIGLLPFYFYTPLKIFGWFTGKVNVSASTILIYALSTIISIFMDGYSFVMFAVGTSIFWAFTFISRPELRKILLKVVLPLHIACFALSYILFIIYIGKFGFDSSELDFFRGWGLDLTFAVIPTRNVFLLFDLLGISVDRSDSSLFGDYSVWVTTFCLPIMVAGVVAWWLKRKKVKLATGAIIVVLFAFYMALGPSLKINSTKPESLAINLPGQQSALMPASLAVMPTGNAWISTYVPGFNVMRASYRWSALGIFALWILVMIAFSEASGKNRLRWIIGLLCIIGFNLPNLERKWQVTHDSRSMFKQIDSVLVKNLSNYIHQNEIATFLPFGNDFIINYLAPRVGFKSYNVGGDKNLVMAMSKWPESLSQNNLDFDQMNEGVILNVLLSGDTDVVVIPYFNMLINSLNSWPCDSESLIGKKKYGVGWNKTFVSKSGQSQEIDFPITSVTQWQNIFISVPEATSPRNLIGVPDDRVLGIALEKISLHPSISAIADQNTYVSDFYSLDIGAGLKNRISLLAKGWYNTESNFIWSNKNASLTLPVPKICTSTKCKVTLKFSVFGASSEHPVNVNFSTISEACPVRFKKRTSKFLELMKSSPYLTVQDGDLFSIIRLRSEFSDASHREVLKTAIVNNVTYPLLFGVGLNTGPFILQSGWYSLEAEHVWSKDNATLRLPIPKECIGNKCSANLKFNVFGSSSARPMIVRFKTEQGGQVWQKELTSLDGENYSVSVPLNSPSGNQILNISVPNATSPQQLGMSEDSRVLGIGLQRIVLNVN